MNIHASKTSFFINSAHYELNALVFFVVFSNRDSQIEFLSLEIMVTVISFAVKSLLSDGKLRATVFWVVIMLK